ncbi:MAG: hypothetical protein Q8N18_22580 [Opitutaceae bacterium]|nr:hypothetical protein [Opitutaceae bacterium]
MSTPATPSAPQPAGDDRNLVPADASPVLTFEDKVGLFWKNHRTLVLVLCVAVVAAIAGKGLMDYLARQKEEKIGAAYAAATTNDQLKAFIAAQPGHTLAGIAHLRLADEAYAANKAADAISGYDRAAAILPPGPLAARARLGRALAKLQTGKTAEATTELKALADDTKQPKTARSEAAYHLTGLAVEAGNATDAQKFIDQLGQLDSGGLGNPWMQRAMMLRATMPASAVPATEEKKADATPAVTVELPKK